MIYKETDIQKLQNRVSELEEQLAEAQAAVRASSSFRQPEIQEKSIRQSIEELNAIIQTLHDPVMVYNQDGVISMANASAIRAHGFDPAGRHRRDTNRTLMVRHPDGSFVPSDELPSARALQGETVIDEALTMINSNGREMSILVTASPLLVNGIQKGVVSVWRDITERKRVEEALRESEERFRAVVENALDAIVVSDPSRGGSILSANPAACRMFGYSTEEFLGLDREAILDLSDPRLAAFLAGHAARGRITGELTYKRKNGERFSGELSSVFFQDRNGEHRAVAIIRDITDRKQAEAALRESEERFRSLADSMPQLVWTALPDGAVDYYNQRYQEYYEIKQMQEGTWEWRPVLHPDDLQLTVDAWEHSVKTGEIYQIEHRVQMADGAYRWHLSRGVPMLDEKRQIVRWFGTATDIHDLKLAEEQAKHYAERLEHSNRELEQFAFMASHDLQEPLRKIEVFGDLLLESSRSLNGRERNYMERMRSAARRMHEMVEGLLQLSRVTTQAKPFVRVDLAAVTSEVLHDLEQQVARVDGRVDLGVLPVIEGDPLQLSQLMQNLIGNALKYHQPDTPPEVKIRASQLPEKVQILVEDHGIGFEQEEAERIFQPFQRLVGRSQYEGSGIGLAICRRIVERHRGEITARSQPGQGTTFIVTLPMHHPESTRDELRKDRNDEKPGIAPGR